MATFLDDTLTDTNGVLLSAHTGATWTRQTGRLNTARYLGTCGYAALARDNLMGVPYRGSRGDLHGEPV